MSTIHIKQALLADGWAENARIEIDVSGAVSNIEKDVSGAE